MGNVFVDDTSLSNIADAIRLKIGTQTTYRPDQMALAIASIPTEEAESPTGEIEISVNGIYDVTNYASANVQVQSSGISEIIVSENCSNALDCLNHIFPSRSSSNIHLYIAVLKDKAISDFETDQLIALLAHGNGSYGIGLRWRNNGVNTIGGLSSNYDAKIVVGDVFAIYEITYE